MNSPSDQPSNHWKSLASELGFEWTEPEPAPVSDQAATADEQESAAVEIPQEAAEADVVSPPSSFFSIPEDDELFSEVDEEVFSSSDESDEQDRLFSDEGFPEDVAAQATLSDEFQEAPEAPPPAGAVADEMTAAPGPDDRSHWLELMSELGLEVPPEPEPSPQPVSAEASPGAEADFDSAMQPERFGDRDTGKAKPDRRKGREVRRTPASLAPSRPFGAGLFGEEEEPIGQDAESDQSSELISREAEIIAEIVVEAEISVAEDGPPALDDEEEATPRKRGRRRTRRWKRLHTSADTTEEGESSASEGEFESAEILEDLEPAEAFGDIEAGEDLFGDLEPETEEEAEDVAARPSDDEQRPRRRRRRRRSRRGERVEAVPATEDSVEDADDEELDVLDEDRSEGDLLEEERPRRERSRRRPAAESSEDRERDDDEAEERGEGRPLHRKIPTWEEAVSVVIDLNMEARARSPGGRRRR